MGLLESFWAMGAKKRLEEAVEQALPRWLYIYQFMPKGYINALFDNASKRGLRNASTANVVAELRAIEEIENRMNTETMPEIPSFETADIAREQMSKWLHMSIRPELFLEYSVVGLSVILSTLCESAQERVLSPIVSPCKTFNTDYIIKLNRYNNSMGDAADYYYKQYVTGDVPGLGFGIITTSVSSALLYDVMNANEIQRQLRLRRGEAAMTTSMINDDFAETLEKDVSDLYETFGKSIIEAVDEVFVAISIGETAADKEEEQKLLEKQKIQEEREKLAQSILEDMKNMKTSTTVSSLRDMDKYAHLSNQQICSGLRILISEGYIMKTVDENRISHFTLK